MNEIKIEVDVGLPERGARINRKTWTAIKERKGDSAFFPPGDQIMVVSDPFDPQYILFIVDDDIADDTMFVSEDVKKMCYPDRDSLTY